MKKNYINIEQFSKYYLILYNFLYIYICFYYLLFFIFIFYYFIFVFILLFIIFLHFTDNLILLRNNFIK